MITKSIKEKIKTYFFLYPTAKLRVRQIEKEMKVPLPSAIRYAKELEKEGILKIIDIAGIKLYSADRTSKEFLMEKRLYNIKSLHNSGLLAHLIEEYNNPVIILFGSYARGEDIENSDIDIYIQITKKAEELESFEKVLKRKIQLFCYADIKKIENKELANNILNGINLNGYVEAL